MEAHLEHSLGMLGTYLVCKVERLTEGGGHMKGRRLLLSLVLAALVALALAGAASADRLDVADQGGDPSRRS
jgi:hypothetical protein